MLPIYRFSQPYGNALVCLRASTFYPRFSALIRTKWIRAKAIAIPFAVAIEAEFTALNIEHALHYSNGSHFPLSQKRPRWRNCSRVQVFSCSKFSCAAMNFI